MGCQIPENGPADAVIGAKFIRSWKFSLRTVAEIHSHVKGEMNGRRKQPPLTYPAISANM